MFEELGVLYRGMVLGLVIAAPVGPVGLLCFRRTVQKGLLIGFATGFGPASGVAAAAARTAGAWRGVEGLIAAGAAAFFHGTHFARDGPPPSRRKYQAPAPPAARNSSAASHVPVEPPADGLARGLRCELGVLVRRLATQR